jgi:tRNA pseudouridine55 synthase
MPLKPFGFLVIDKPAGVTSHDVVVCVRRSFHTRQVGHLGTLDPMATGVLPLAWGKATRLIQYIPHDPKVYAGTIRLGFSTSTYDREGEPTSIWIKPEFTDEKIQETARSFEGEQFQIPPVFSAKKVNGRPSYRLARKGQEVRLSPHPIRIDRFEVARREPDLLDIMIQCSPGTYIRSVAHDFGWRLQCGAHLVNLRRIRSGIFSLEQAISWQQVEEWPPENLDAAIIPAEEVVHHLGAITLSADLILAAKNGQRFQAAVPGSGELAEPLFRLLDGDGNLVGLAVPVPNPSGLTPALTLQPKLVLI